MGEHKWADEERETVLRVLSELTPEQRAHFPEDVRRGDRGFKMTERWLLDEFLGLQPGQNSMN